MLLGLTYASSHDTSYLAVPGQVLKRPNFSSERKNMNYFIECFTEKFAVFSGRARRSEYWWFTLWNTLFAMLASLMYSAVTVAYIGPIVYLAYVAYQLLPALAVSVRRLHDTGKTGWWMLIGVIPFLGGVVLLVFMCQDSDHGHNKYGPNPKPCSDTH